LRKWKTTLQFDKFSDDDVERSRKRDRTVWSKEPLVSVQMTKAEMVEHLIGTGRYRVLTKLEPRRVAEAKRQNEEHRQRANPSLQPCLRSSQIAVATCRGYSTRVGAKCSRTRLDVLLTCRAGRCAARAAKKLTVLAREIVYLSNLAALLRLLPDMAR
jgi:hypothetical protein